MQVTHLTLSRTGTENLPQKKFPPPQKKKKKIVEKNPVLALANVNETRGDFH